MYIDIRDHPIKGTIFTTSLYILSLTHRRGRNKLVVKRNVKDAIPKTRIKAIGSQF